MDLFGIQAHKKTFHCPLRSCHAHGEVTDELLIIGYCVLLLTVADGITLVRAPEKRLPALSRLNMKS
jgi:hypothetical protein